MSESCSIGISITMNQREPYYTGADTKGLYTIFGHFDEMRMNVIDSSKQDGLKLFSLEALYNDLSKRDKKERMQYHPETQKLFLWIDRISTAKRDMMLNYAEGNNGKLFISLFAVKLRRQLINQPRSCDPCICIEKYLHSIADRKEVDICVMHSLSIDDIYIFIGADSPKNILRCLHHLQNFVCDFTSHDEKPDGTKAACDQWDSNRIKNTAKKAREKLEELRRRVSQDIREEKHHAAYKNCIDEAIGDIQTIESSGTLLSYDKVGSHTERFNCINETSERSFSEQLWIMKCIDLIRTRGPMPGILMTHSFIGYNSNHSEIVDLSTVLPGNSKPAYEDIFFIELEIKLRPGVGFQEFRDRFTEALIEAKIKECSPESIDEELTLVVGQYDYVWRTELSTAQIVRLYNNKVMCWNMREHYDPPPLMENSSARYFLPKDLESLCNQEDAENIINLKKQMREEETLLAQIWVNEEQDAAGELFKSRSDEYSENFPYLQDMINDISFLHAQGCRRFFYALTWKEFDTVRRFFWKFYEKLGRELQYFDNLKKERPNDESLPYYASMIYHSMELFRDSISSVFNERMMLDTSMRKNTHTGVYATGAYEELLKLYRRWSHSLRDLLVSFDEKMVPEEHENGQDIKDSTNQLYFLLVPVIGDGIHSHQLFPLSHSDNTLVIYRAPFDHLIKFDSAFPMFVHELGHYLGVVNRKVRINVYIQMVSYLFAWRVARALCKRNYDTTPIEALHMFINNLRDGIYDYLKFCLNRMCENPELEKQSYYLQHVRDQCKIWFNDFLRKFIKTPEKSLPEEMKSLAGAIVDLYDVLNALPLLAKEGRLFEMLLEDVVNDILGEAQLFVRECYADLLMITVLGLKDHEYLMVLLNALETRDARAMTVGIPTGGVKPGSNSNIDAVRLISAIFLINSIERGYNENDFETALTNIPTAINELVKSLDEKVDQKAAKALSKTLKLIDSKKSTGILSDYLGAWRLLSLYLFHAAIKIRKKLNEKSTSCDFSNELEKRYREIIVIEGKDDTNMNRLFRLLQEKEEI